MKILKLTIHNIASIKDAVIDFTSSPLDSAGLFLISGRTGAGKSTILDCICLALYDDTPRLKNTLAKDNVRDTDTEASIASNDTRQLLRKYSAEGFAQLEFTGNNDVTYRATWSVSRAHKKQSGKLQSTKRTLERLDTNHVLDKKKEIDAEILNAVNLDFNQFCRTVMLAQGEFTKFLNSNDADKAAILSKVTGTEIYTILGKRIFERFRSEEQIFAQCQLALQNLEMLSDEQRNSKNAEISALSSDIKQLTVSLSEYTAILTSLDNRQRHEAELQRLANKKLKLAADFSKFLLGVKRLEESRANLDSQIQNIHKEISEYADRAVILDNKDNLISAIDQIDNLNSVIKKDQQTISDRSSHKESVLLPEFIRLNKGLEDNAHRLNDEQQAAIAVARQINTLNLAGVRAERDRLLQSRIDFENLNIASDIYAKCLDEITLNKKLLAETEQELEALSRQLNDWTTPALVAKVKLETLQENHDKLFASSEKILSKIRNSLHPGDTCPICQSKITNPLPPDANVAAIIAESKRSLEEAGKDVERMNKAIADTEAAIKVKTKEVMNLKSKIEDDSRLRASQVKVQEICKKLNIECGDIDIQMLRGIYRAGIENIGNETSALKNIIDRGEKLEKDLREHNVAVQNLHDMTSDAERAVNGIQLKIAACDSQIATLSAHIATSSDNITALKTGISSTIGNSPYLYLREDFVALKDKINDDANRLKQLRDSSSTLETECDRLGNNIAANNATATAIREYLPEDPESVPFVEIGDIPTGNPLNFGQTLIGELKACRELTASAEKQLDEENNNIGSWEEKHPDSPLNMEILSEKCITMQEEIEAKNRLIGALDAELKRDDANRDKKQKLFDEFRQQEKSLEKWRTLYELFGDSDGKKFRKIAQSYILSELIRSANHYLGGFTERYRLAIEPGTFIILVEDAWNGYTRRPASTISGGESFMVSLSLALALSDLNTDFSVDILFIDEGFGSLSAEYLQSAISTLRTLHRKSGRRIGIISHVEELRERIPVQINVESAPNSSYSTVSITA